MKSSKKKTNTERKRHPAKTNTERKRHPAKPAKKAAPKKVAKKAAPKKVAKVKPAKKAAPKKVAKKAPAKVVKRKPANTERKRHPAKRHHAKAVKAKPAKKAAPKKVIAKKPVKKVAPKKSLANTQRKRHPAKGRQVSASAPSPSSRRGEKKAKQSPKAVKPSNTERPRHHAKKAAKKEPKEKAKKPAPAANSTASGSATGRFIAPDAGQSLPARSRLRVADAVGSERKRHHARAAKAVATPVRPQKRETGALIISKRGRKSKKERAAAESQSIFVPRDVKAENTEENQTRNARAYSPDELEQLLSSRGVSNMNVFDPKTAITAKVEKKKTQKKIILTTLPKAKKKKTVGPVSVSDLFGFNPFAKNSTSQEEKLIPEKWRKYYRKLMDRKEALLARLNDHSEKAFQKEGKEETGDVSAYSQHTADIDNDAFDRDLALSRLPAEQEELSEINIAIERMKKGTYGICEITGKPIPAERLNKVPFTRYSLEGKLEAEKQRGLAARRRRANTTGDISEVIDLENDAPVQLPEEETEEQQ